MQPLTIELGGLIQTLPATFHELLISLGKSRRTDDPVIFQPSSLLVSRSIQRLQYLGCKAPRFFQYRLHHVGRGFLKAGMPGN